MRSELVLVVLPVINRFTDMNDIAKPVLVQALISKASVKTLKKSVLIRFTWLDKTQPHAMLKDPLNERSANALRPLIGSYRSRITPKQRNTVQNKCDLNV